ncbi:MAG: hypothetical protein WCO33_02425 [bacterium]
MDRIEFNQNRIIRLIKEGFKEKPNLTPLRKRNLDKIVNNSIELASAKQKNRQLDRTVSKLVQEKPKMGFIGFINSLAKWQLAMISVFALIFITSGVALANPSISENIKTALSIETGTLQINSNITGSNVYLRNVNDKDFKMVGVTDLTLDKTPAGDYEFYIQKDGYVQSDIIHFSLSSGKFYNKFVTLNKTVDESSVKYLDFTNSDFGIYLKYPETAIPTFEKYSDDSFKLTIKSSDAIFVLQSQDTQPTLLPDFTSVDLKISGVSVQGRKYTYKNVGETYSKESYKYGISTNGLFQVNGINYFIYTESLNEHNPLFDNIVADLALTNKKQDAKTYKEYKFSDQKLGISFSYYDDFIYSTLVNNSNEYKIRLENKDNKNLAIILDWKGNAFGASDDINFSNSSNVSQTTLNSVTAYTLISNGYEMAYLLPNNIAIYSYKYGSLIEADRLLKQKDLFMQTFQSNGIMIGGISYPYSNNSNTTTTVTSQSSSSATSSYKTKD